MKKVVLILPLLLLLHCAEGQILKKAKGLLGGGGSFTTEEAANALKQALEQGTIKGVSTLSVKDGYFKNPQVRIPFPEEARNVEEKLRTIGAGKLVDDTEEALNRAAELAAEEAKDIFVATIKRLTVRDAINIVKGEPDAATRFLERETTEELTVKFKPIIDNSLEKVDATKYWTDVMGKYNQIPFVKKVNPDLTAYVTQKALDGLFVMIAQEELNIRQNPAARTTALLEKVFK